MGFSNIDPLLIDALELFDYHYQEAKFKAHVERSRRDRERQSKRGGNT